VAAGGALGQARQPVLGPQAWEGTGHRRRRHGGRVSARARGHRGATPAQAPRAAGRQPGGRAPPPRKRASQARGGQTHRQGSAPAIGWTGPPPAAAPAAGWCARRAGALGRGGAARRAGVRQRGSPPVAARRSRRGALRRAPHGLRAVRRQAGGCQAVPSVHADPGHRRLGSQRTPGGAAARLVPSPAAAHRPFPSHRAPPRRRAHRTARARRPGEPSGPLGAAPLDVALEATARPTTADVAWEEEEEGMTWHETAHVRLRF
jgi:hypothetical protein